MCSSLHQENWKGKNSEVQDANAKDVRVNRSKSTILDVEPEVALYVRTLKNGETTIGHKGKTISSVNTCGFDSLFQILMCVYSDYRPFAELLNNSSDAYSDFIQNCSFSAGSTERKIYKMRNELLIQLLPEKIIAIGQRYIEMDCSLFINDLYPRVAKICNPLHTQKVEHACTHCNTNWCKENSFMRFNLFEFDVKNIEKSIFPPDDHAICKQCQHPVNKNTLLGIIVAFDVEGRLENIMLDDIQKNIRIHGQQYVLAGCIERRSSHFIAHCLRLNQCFEKFDDLSYSSQTSEASGHINCCLLIFRQA